MSELFKQIDTQRLVIQKIMKDAYDAGYKKRDDEIKEAQRKTVELEGKLEDEYKSYCPKCGEPVLGDEDGLCGRCV